MSDLKLFDEKMIELMKYFNLLQWITLRIELKTEKRFVMAFFGQGLVLMGKYLQKMEVK